MKVTIIIVLFAVLLLSACSFNLPVSATSNPIGAKKGTFVQTGYLGFPPPMSNKAAVYEAAKNGGITKISTVDQNITWLLVMTKYETIVTGE